MQKNDHSYVVVFLMCSVPFYFFGFAVMLTQSFMW